MRNRKIFFPDLSRFHKQTLMILADIALLIFAGWAAYALRFGERFVPSLSQFLLLCTAPLLTIPVFLRMGLYRSVIRYMGEHALWVIVKSVTLSALLWTGLAFMTAMTGIAGVPRSVPILYWLLTLSFVVGIRFAARWLLWLPLRERYAGRQVLIYGAGCAGRELAASLRAGREFFPAAYLDDNPNLHGKDVAGLRVYPPYELPMLMQRYDIRDVIVTMPGATSIQRKEVVSFLEQFPLKVRILPALSDIASGKHLVSMLREVDVGDLLGRDPVAADPALLGHCIKDKVVLVTGAGGSIGSELCQQIAAQHPQTLVLLEQSEPALYQTARRLQQLDLCPIVACLGSVTDQALVEEILQQQGVNTIYHAAAHKHVPLIQENILEGVRNNIFGTRTLAQAALASQVEHFVLISTDKAVRPTNIMGATKRWAEIVIQEMAQLQKHRTRATRFCAVRFGNVLGSSGSVIPLFKEQIAKGGPVTVTHPEVTRYFMSIHEAVQLVIQASSLAKGGEIFLLDMGEPVKIIDLAHNMIRLAGYTIRDAENLNGDIEIEYIGLRPGEKLYEELLIQAEGARASIHPKICQANEPGANMHFASIIQELETHLVRRDTHGAARLLMKVACPAEVTESTRSHTSITENLGNLVLVTP